MNSTSPSPELSYALLVLGLFLVPRLLQRFRLPGAITSVALGALLSMGFGAFHGDPTIEWLGTLGIVALFLFAGLDVDFRELRRGASVVVQHVLLQTVVLVVGAVVCAATLGLHDRAAVLLALALFTPSTGFILDSLGRFGLDGEQRFWVKSKAIGAEIVALLILFLTVQSSDARTLVGSSAAMIVLVAVLPWIFRVFSERILPHAPQSEFAFLVIVAMLSAFLTRRLGVYYLVGAFVVGLSAVRMKTALPGLVSEKVIGAVELFASFFVPFYFLKAGLHLSPEDFSPRAIGLGLLFLVIAVPIRVATVAFHRRWVLGESLKEAARVGLSLVPTLVFTMVIASILIERYHVDRTIHGALIVFALGNTLLPGLFLAARIDFDGSDTEDESAKKDGIVAESAHSLEDSAEASTEIDEESVDVLDGTLTALDRPPDDALGRTVRHVQNLAFDGIVDGKATRDQLVAIRLKRIASTSGRYWAEVFSSAAIGGVGVLLDSVPLVVAAALACPIVAPITGLALGLASGSSFLVLRTLIRGALGIFVAVSVAGLATRLAPFVVAPTTFEVSTPTLLDLAAAIACAFIAVLAELRSGSVTGIVAARAAVGYLVVVPVCQMGFSIATGAWSSVAVATWSLSATVSTVVVVGLFVFLLLGMHRVDANEIESRELEGLTHSPARLALLKPLRRAFDSRFGPALRIVMPLSLLVLASIPLFRAFDVAAKEVRLRAMVERDVRSLPDRILESRVEIDAAGVSVTVLQVGDERSARRSRRTLEQRLQSSTRRQVHVDVVAVPDATTLADLQDELRSTSRSGVSDEVQEAAQHVRSQLESEPRSDRSILDVTARITANDIEAIATWVGPVATEAELVQLGEDASEALGRRVIVRAPSFGSEEVAFDPTDVVALSVVAARAELAERTPGLRLCLSRPVPQDGERPSPRTVEQVAKVDAAFGHRASVELVDADAFRHRFASVACRERAAPTSAPLDGGTPQPGAAR